MSAVEWAVTEPNPRMGHRYNGCSSYPRSGWKRHAVRVPDSGSIFRPGEIPKALCGLRPKSGWGVDLYEDDMEPCRRCLKSSRKEGIADPIGVHFFDYAEASP